MRALTDATAGLLAPVPLGPHDRLDLTLEPDGRWFRARVTADDSNGHRNYPTASARTSWLERVREKRQLATPSDSWLLAATDYTAEVVNAVWPRDRLRADPSASTMLDLLLLGTTAQEGVAEDYALFKAVVTGCLQRWKGAVAAGATEEELEALKAELVALQRSALPDGARALEVHPDCPLDPIQQMAAWLSTRTTGYSLYMEQGTGKTPVVVARVMNEVDRVREQHGRAYRGIVVCPRAVRLNWVREFQRFCTRPGKVEAIRGGWAARATAIVDALRPEPGCEYSVVVMSYESLQGSWDLLEHVDWDLGVLDEAHYAKRPMTQRSQRTRKLRDKCRRRMCLTGTPVSNTPLDLYALFEFLGEGWSGFQSHKAFKDFFGVFDQTGDGYAKLVGVQNLPFMKERLTRTSFMVSSEEALPWLPERTFDVVEAEMGAAQREAYEAIAKELAYQVEDQLDASNNKAVTIQNVLTQLLRLEQVCCGYVAWDAVVDPGTGEVVRESRLEYFDENPKLDALVEMLREKREAAPHRKTIVWSCFVPCIRQVSERLAREGFRHVVYYGGSSEAEREEAERAFNCDPGCAVFVGNQGAGGVGLNLLGYPPHEGDGVETDCDQHVWYAVDWSYVKRAQGGKRSHRRGARVPFRETDLVVPETMDEDIRVRVMEKKMMAMEVADVREILSSILRGIKL